MPQPASRAGILLLMLIFCLALPALAAPPATMPYQGKLYDAEGQALSGPVDVTFSLYDAAWGGDPLWSETHSGVVLVDGEASVLLGSLTPLDLPFDQPYWLGVAVNGGRELSPRKALSGAPYAFRAVNADTAYTATTVESTAAVTSFNAATGAMTMAGSAPVSVDTTDQTITISSDAVAGVTAGTGLTDSGTAGEPVLAVEYGGDGSNDTAARSDHVHDELYYTQTALQTAGGVQIPWGNLTNTPTLVGPYGNIVIVAKSGGQFTTIQAAIDSITDASESNQYLVWVMPGVYEEAVSLKDYVNLKGSGRKVTIITGSSSATVALDLPRHCRISDLTVSVQDRATYGKGIQTYPRAEVHIARVDVEMSFTAWYGYGMDISYNSTVHLEDVNVKLTKEDITKYGITAIQSDTSNLKMNRVTAMAVGSLSAFGVVFETEDDDTCELVADDCHFSGVTTGYQGQAFEVTNNEYDPDLAIARISNSRLQGSHTSIYNDGGTILLRGCELEGAVQDSYSGATCAACYDSDFAALGADCQAIP